MPQLVALRIQRRSSGSPPARASSASGSPSPPQRALVGGGGGGQVLVQDAIAPRGPDASALGGHGHFQFSGRSGSYGQFAIHEASAGLGVGTTPAGIDANLDVMMWHRQYVLEVGRQPTTVDQFRAFVLHRGGDVPYCVARRILPMR